MTNTWPLQKECTSYYGNPRSSSGGSSSKWESANLTLVKCPWVLRYDGTPVKGLRVHKKTADSLARVLAAIWERVGKSQAEIDRIGMSIYGGAYNFRLMRGGSSLSMHSWGCAIDFDPERNGLGDHTPAMDRRVIEEFEREGWEWGGHWSRPDGMHFQAAWSRANPPRLKGALPPKFAPGAKPQTVVPPPPVAAVSPAPQPQAQTQEPVLTLGEARTLGGVAIGGGAAAKATTEVATAPPPPVDPVATIDQLKQASEHVSITQSLTTGVVDMVNAIGANPWLWGIIFAGGAYVGLRIYRRRRAASDTAQSRPVMA